MSTGVNKYKWVEKGKGMDWYGCEWIWMGGEG